MTVMPETNTRDHLSNERTFLAWVRTAIALISFGVVIARLRFPVAEVPGTTVAPHSGGRATLLGIAFAVTGLLTLAFAALHHEQTRHAIETGSYRASGRAVRVFAVLILLLGAASLAYLLTLVPG